MRRFLLVSLGLVLAVAVVYGRTAGFGFVSYDDPPYVAANPVVLEGLTWRGLVWALSEPHGGNWHPLTGLSHMLDVELFGPRPGAHHLVNVAWHAAASVLVFALFETTTRATWAAATVAGLFALHPTHVESVAWISERKDVLSAAFGLAALVAWTRWTRLGGAARYLAALGLAALGLAAKPMLVTLPCVMLLLDVWPLDRRALGWPRLVREKLPFFAASAVSSALTVVFQAEVGAVNTNELVPLPARLANAVVACVRYVGKLAWPTDLGVLYQHPSLPGGQPWTALEVAGAALVLAGLTALVLRSRPATVGWLVFLGMLVPVLGIVQVGEQGMADRYLYLPSIGAFAAVVYPLASLARRGPGLRLALASLACAALLASGALAWRQVGTWRDSQSLFRQALSASPRSPTVLVELGGLCQERFDLACAEQHYRAALAVAPDHANANYNLGFVLQASGRPEEALVCYARALERQPGHLYARNALGRLHQERGEHELARAAYEDVLARAPFADAELNLGSLEAQLGRPDLARAHYESALAIDPDYAGAHFNLGRLLLAAGEDEAALAAFERALAIDPGQPAFGRQVAWLLATRAAWRDPQRAVRLAEKAAARAPGDPWVLDTVAAAWAAAGDFAVARSSAGRALDIARASGLTELAAELEARLALYEADTPYTEPEAP
jgi:tetratricopeptide (TPR) repeat protein